MVLPVAEPTQAGEARRRVAALAREAGWNETDAGRAALVATEAAGNLAKHTTAGGVLLARVVRAEGGSGIELLALDGGPGIARVAEAMRDGYSTAGSPGTGLGAIARMSQHFDLHSIPGAGTALLATLWPRGWEAPAGEPEVGAVCVPAPGETVCGDAWALTGGAGGTMAVLVVDGLGHGPGAAEVAAEALRSFSATAELPPAARLDRLHEVLRGTRGAAGAIAEVDPARGALRYAAAGNISGSLVTGEAARSLVTHNGTLGHQVRTIQEFEYPWTPGALLVMHSDGITTRWALERYPGLSSRHPALVAGTLYRDFCRGRDDATVVAMRAAAPALA